jgi:enoyl-CoA hydratase
MSALVHYDLSDRIASVTMDDGKVNALSNAMLAELGAALDRAEADGAVVLLSGRPGVFSAGFDLGVLRAGGPDADRMVLAAFELAVRLLSFPSPVLIACTGHALAMGMLLLLAADLRVGAAGDHKLGLNEVAIGIVMPEFGIEMCRQRLTPAYANRAVVNAEIFTPDEALAGGVLDGVVAPDELARVARERAAELARLDPAVHTATKLRARADALVAIRAAIEAREPAAPSGG